MSLRTRALLVCGGTAAAAACLIGLSPAASAATPATTPSSTPAPSAQAAACDRAPWEAKVQGHPKAYHPGAASGDYLWHSRTGFHLRVTHRRSDRAVYSGRFVSSAPMRLDRVKLEGKDAVAISANRRIIYFRFDNHGRTDGINFHTDCARALTVSRLQRGGHRLANDHVFLGAKTVHPAHIPFTVHRRS